MDILADSHFDRLRSRAVRGIDVPKSRRLRFGRWSESGRIYLVTITCFERRKVFTRLEHAQCFARSIQRIRHEVRTWCWIAMPDHVHCLFQMKGEHDLSLQVQKLKSLTSRCIHVRGTHAGQVWQSGFHDRAIRKDENLRASARYIIANPVRAGLVDSVASYPYWDAVWLGQKD